MHIFTFVSKTKGKKRGCTRLPCDTQFQKMVESIHSPPHRRDQNFLGVRGSMGHKKFKMCMRLYWKFQRGWKMGLLEKNNLSQSMDIFWNYTKWEKERTLTSEYHSNGFYYNFKDSFSQKLYHLGELLSLPAFCKRKSIKSNSYYVNEWLDVKCLKLERNKCLTYLSLLASRSDSSKVKMSPSRTGPLTLRMMDRFVSSKNSTRT